MSSYRLDTGGTIDRRRRIAFTFDGRPIAAHPGDTVASALLAAGVRLVGRSFKYHRPRGLVAAGVEEPNGLVTLRQGGRREPNTPATVAEVSDGLVVESQNRWPSLAVDVMALNGLASPMLTAGFYYKTFMAPGQAAWMRYERAIRRAAGLGVAAGAPDPDAYEKLTAHCDVLVVGAGPAGLIAAEAAAAAGCRVILADSDAAAGGALRWSSARLSGPGGQEVPAVTWVDDRMRALAANPRVTLMSRTTVYGYFDDQQLAAVERVADHLIEPAPYQPRQRHWMIRARQVVLATGAVERPLIFAGNDRPGIMLASAGARYALQYGVAVGRRVVLATDNDYAYRLAVDMAGAGVAIALIVDRRAQSPAALTDEARRCGIEVRTASVVMEARGRGGVARVAIADAAASSMIVEWVACDAVLMSGGWSPVVHLASQSGGAPQWDGAIQAFVPGARRGAWTAAGAARGALTLASALASGRDAVSEALHALDGDGDGRAPAIRSLDLPECRFEEGDPTRTLPPAEIKGGRGKAFVDFQNDVTAKDIRQAHREGYISVEHLKRYTTLGMATDQGKTSNVPAIAVMADARGIAIAEAGTTRFRAPYTGVALGALAGREVGAHHRPLRTTPMHAWHVAHGGAMANYGQWQRPRAYLQAGEDIAAAYKREAQAVRAGVGIVDVSTLGKIMVVGPDAGTFLDRLYINMFSTLAVGRARYGVMLREDGFVFDDGTAWRLADDRYLVTTTTANAAAVLQHLELSLATLWPELRVRVATATDQWGALAVAGPRAREVLSAAAPDIDWSHAAFKPMAIRHGTLAGAPVMAARLSFSGELAFEIMCGAGHAQHVWDAVLAAGAGHGIVPYGVEAMGALRIEKGHVAGGELDGRTTLHDLALAGMASKSKAFIGKALMQRAALVDPNRLRLVGLVSLDGAPIRGGAHIVAGQDAKAPGRSEGHVTSWTYSPVRGTYIALGLLERGPERHGERLFAADPVRNGHTAVEVVAPTFYDPDGGRQNG